ncbi:MFS transporter [Photobacterium nomapromontoriensis]|uniref:MFS transporter n=1 Tax=Photobacterium nomapromontoriensis TaxID=2910237 RepID=UPI003D0FD27F
MVMPVDMPLSKRVKDVIQQKKHIFFLSCLILSLGQLCLSLIFPLLPWIAEELHLSSQTIQWIIISYLLGYGPSQLLYGPLSYRYGRRPVVLFGILISIIGFTIVIFNTDSFFYIVLGRFIQGLGGGCESVLARAIIHDSYKSKYFLTATTGLAIFSACVPVCSPIIGGIINHHYGWYSVLCCLFIYVVIVYILLIIFLPETVIKKDTNFSLPEPIRTYRQLIKDRYFIHYSIISSLNGALIIFLMAWVPFVLESEFQFSSEQYAFWSVIPAIALFLSSWWSFHFRHSYSTSSILMVCPIIQFLSGLCLMLYPHEIFFITVCFFIIGFLQGLIFPCAQALLMVPYGNYLGTVSALSGALQMVFAGLALVVINIESITNFVTVIMFVSLCTALMIFIDGAIMHE